jgi:hypothetical protein
MNQFTAGPGLQPNQPHHYRDRRQWLVVFGVVEILIASFFVLMAATMAFLLPNLPKPPGQPQLPGSFSYFIAATYLGIAAFFVVVGVGSIRSKNWARIAMIVVSSLWLVVGVMSTASAVFLMPRILQQQRAAMPPAQASQLPPNFDSMFTVIVGISTAVIMVAVPLGLLLFYCGKNVKATCQARSGIASTNRLPISVIILVIWFSFVALSTLASAAFFPLTALFGFIFHGTAARIVGVAFFLASAYCAWNMYKLRFQGWVAGVITSATTILSGVITLWRVNPAILVEESYRSMGMTPEQLASQDLDLQSPRLFWGLGLLVSAALLALIVYTKRYFKPDQGQPKGLAAGA